MTTIPPLPHLRRRRVHELKTWSQHYWLVVQGYKTFDWRRNDRGYMATDLLHLREYNPETDEYTSESSWYEVLYVLRGSDASQSWGVPEDYCIMSIVPIDINDPLAMYYAP